ncbi:hypothetical protein M409DRAFT_25248 [Zasmidium cellare ATCC 36951]|uniref:Apple domain-containing protein n=1 Tax=Zasmidium cellare ATCC 36951 TaxID=1080233 RepID=A0A6A6CFB9_ZASCE|nr:uncharacterized protein M409DRAFT_25248 [Zasmidium cellare ATCC 36951]KAF2164369.1 hypothetical protein M409DRAFT_25248 [Zasmidium cellare ATCC 36951]
MINNRNLLAGAALIGSALASPAPQQLDFAQIAAAPVVASGPSAVDSDGVQTATLYTSVAISGVATASATATSAAGNARRDATTSGYTPYYPALATGYTTDPALTATTSAGQACPTTPEAGTYCGFINPLDPCAPQPDGYGPVPTPDTASAFLAYPPFHSSAQAAPTNVPSVNNTQYSQVFKDLNASVSAQSYLGLYSLQSYDVAGCAAKCDSTDLCTAFNIFIERDPSLNPSANDSTAPTVWGYWCPNPPSMTVYKCTLWGSNIDASMATNTGEKRHDFDVVITGSDGYDKTNITTPPECSPPVVSSTSSVPVPTTTSTTSKSTVPASTTTTTSTAKPTSSSTPAWPNHPWGPPKNCHGKGINNGKNWMGSRFFPGPFNPQVCSDYALLQNLANAKAKNGQKCQMFNAYYLHKNQKPLGTYCNLYNAYLDSSWATFSGAKSGRDQYDCKQSWTYTLQE